MLWGGLFIEDLWDKYTIFNAFSLDNVSTFDDKSDKNNNKKNITTNNNNNKQFHQSLYTIAIDEKKDTSRIFKDSIINKCSPKTFTSKDNVICYNLLLNNTSLLYNCNNKWESHLRIMYKQKVKIELQSLYNFSQKLLEQYISYKLCIMLPNIFSYELK